MVPGTRKKRIRPLQKRTAPERGAELLKEGVTANDILPRSRRFWGTRPLCAQNAERRRPATYDRSGRSLFHMLKTSSSTEPIPINSTASETQSYSSQRQPFVCMTVTPVPERNAGLLRGVPGIGWGILVAEPRQIQDGAALSGGRNTAVQRGLTHCRRPHTGPFPFTATPRLCPKRLGLVAGAVDGQSEHVPPRICKPKGADQLRRGSRSGMCVGRLARLFSRPSVALSLHSPRSRREAPSIFLCPVFAMGAS
jgi:hypothetical protein